MIKKQKQRQTQKHFQTAEVDLNTNIMTGQPTIIEIRPAIQPLFCFGGYVGVGWLISHRRYQLRLQ